MCGVLMLQSRKSAITSHAENQISPGLQASPPSNPHSSLLLTAHPEAPISLGQIDRPILLSRAVFKPHPCPLPGSQASHFKAHSGQGAALAVPLLGVRSSWNPSTTTFEPSILAPPPKVWIACSKMRSVPGRVPQF